MQTIDKVKANCRDVGERIEKAVADGVGYVFDSETCAALVEFFNGLYHS